MDALHRSYPAQLTDLSKRFGSIDRPRSLKLALIANNASHRRWLFVSDPARRLDYCMQLVHDTIIDSWPNDWAASPVMTGAHVSGIFPKSNRPGKGSDASRASARVRSPLAKGDFHEFGTVKWFNSQKGFGFIQPADGGKDIFVHISAVERAGLSSLNEGQKLQYEVVADRRTGKSSADKLSVD
jgi:cold shock protein